MRVTVEKMASLMPLAEGMCSHGKAVLFNLAGGAGAIFHPDLHVCDGYVLSLDEERALVREASTFGATYVQP